MPKVGEGARVTVSVLLSDGPANRVRRLDWLLSKLSTAPQDWLDVVVNNSDGQVALEPVECKDYAVLVSSWREALMWTDGLDYALSIMLASIISTRTVGDQLWFKILGPASCGKSTLCEALSVARKYVLAKSTFKGFHSGFVHNNAEEHELDEDAGERDPRLPLIERVKNMTLVTKDGDTLLQQPNLPQILSEGRDIYDRVSRIDYRNGQGRDVAGVNMTWLLCGTSSLKSIDSSELGERFLDCKIMDGIDPDLEDAVLDRVAERASRCMSIEADGTAASQQEPKLTRAMQLTGGYVNYLRENAIDLLSTVDLSPEYLKTCTKFGKFVAYMRARPSKTQDEKAEREFAARLVSQHIRTAKALAAAMGKTVVDIEVMQRVRRVCLDTATGKTLSITAMLYDSLGSSIDSITNHVNGVGLTSKGDDKIRLLMRFLRHIGVVELYTPPPINGVTQKARWKLTERLKTLYRQVVVDSNFDVPF